MIQKLFIAAVVLLCLCIIRWYHRVEVPWRFAMTPGVFAVTSSAVGKSHLALETRLQLEQ